MKGGAVWLGELSYVTARALQEQLVNARQRDAIDDTVLILSHPPTITLGKRTTPADFPLGQGALAQRGVQLVEVERGGGPTYHGPGQLVIYPVVSLDGRGVKQFVERGLQTLAVLASCFGVQAQGELDPAGLWVSGARSGHPAAPKRKLGAVGLKIERGVTNHGFSFNVNVELEIYDLFRPCSLSGAAATSLAHELPGSCPELKVVAQRAVELFSVWPSGRDIGAGESAERKSTYPAG